jgi:hypothetical protein
MATILFGVEAALKAMLRDISEHYEIPYEDLEARYLVPKEGDENSTLPESDDEVESKPKKVSKPKSKPKAKAKSEDEDERPKCAATTAKGAPCKNLALAGLCYCRVHQNKFGDSDDEEEKPKKKVSKAKSKTKKSKKVVDPEELIASDEEETPKKKSKKAETPKAPKKAHTHKVDEEEGDCAECASGGNPVKKLEDEFEEDEETSKKLESLLDKLDAMGAGSDDEEENEDEDEEKDMFEAED